MIYKVTGTRKQFDLLSIILDDYIRLFNGDMGCLLAYSRMAFCKRANKTKLTNQSWLSSINNAIRLIIDGLANDIREIGKTEETTDWLEQHDKVQSMFSRLRIILDIDTIHTENDKAKDKLSFEFDTEELTQLSNICNETARMICGQPFSIRYTLTSAWYNMSPRNVNVDDDILYDKIDMSLNMLHTLCWHTADNELDGIHYNEDSDMLFDIHQVIRHALWEDTSDDNKSQYTVNADKPMQYSKQPLMKIERIIDK